jgi:VCBS repeat-containing protein
MSVADVDTGDIVHVQSAILSSGSIPFDFTIAGDTLVYDPHQFNDLNAGEVAAPQVDVTFVDSKGATVTQTLTLNITGLNDVLEVTQDAPAQTLDLATLMQNTGVHLSGDVHIQNVVVSPGSPDFVFTVAGDTLEYDPHQFNYLPDGESTIAALDITFTDGQGRTETKTLLFNITGAEDAPLAQDVSLVSVTKDDSVQSMSLIPLMQASDVDSGDIVQVQSVVLADGSSPFIFTLTDGNLVYDPHQFADLFTGESVHPTLNVTFEDASGETVTKTLTLNITGLNEELPIVTQNDPVQTLDLSTLMQAAGVHLGAGAHIESAFQGNGSVFFLFNYTDNTLSYNPQQFVRLEDGETATPSALITFADDSGTEVTKTLNFTITGLNDAPFAASQTYYNPGGGGIKTIDLNSFLFAQDIDDGDSVHIQKVVLSPGSVPFSFFVSSDGIFTCDTNQFNSAPFSIFGRLAPSVDVTFEDTHGATTTKTFTFDVRGVNLPPVPHDDTYTLTENTSLFVPAPGVLGNDEHSYLTVLDTGLPAGSHSAFSFFGDGRIFYTPESSFSANTPSIVYHGKTFFLDGPGFTGTESFTYKTWDVNTEHTSNTSATVTFIVKPAPVVHDDSYTLSFFPSILATGPGILLNDANNAAYPVLIDNVKHGTLNLFDPTSLGGFSYVADPGFIGIDSFTYRAINSDFTAISTNVATVTLDVQVNTPLPNLLPTAFEDNLSVMASTATGNVLANDTDPEGATLHLVAVGTHNLVSGSLLFTDSNGTLGANSNGDITFTPSNNFYTTHTFPGGHEQISYSYVVTDGIGNTTSQLHIDVPSPAPILISPIPDQSILKHALSVVTYNVSPFFTSTQPLTYAATFQGSPTLPAGITFNQSTGVFTETVPYVNQGEHSPQLHYPCDRFQRGGRICQR